jgi:hypothetical protein
MHAIDQIKLVGLLVCFLAKQEIDSGLSVFFFSKNAGDLRLIILRKWIVSQMRSRLLASFVRVSSIKEEMAHHIESSKQVTLNHAA